MFAAVIWTCWSETIASLSAAAILVESNWHVCCSNLDVFGGELRSNNGFTGTDLAECMIYRRRTWQGILPVNHLAQWALSNKVSQHSSVCCMRASLQLLLLQSILCSVYGNVCKSVQNQSSHMLSVAACPRFWKGLTAVSLCSAHLHLRTFLTGKHCLSASSCLRHSASAASLQTCTTE